MRHVGWRSVWRRRGFTLKLLLLASFASLLNAMAVQAQQQAPELLTYQELVQLYEQETRCFAKQVAAFAYDTVCQ